MHSTVQNSVYCWPGGACWAAGQWGAERPVMCVAGLTVWACGGGAGDVARQSGLCSPGAAAACYGLSWGFAGVSSSF